MIDGKGKSITLKTTKDNASSNELITNIISEESSSPKEEEMAL